MNLSKILAKIRMIYSILFTNKGNILVSIDRANLVKILGEEEEWDVSVDYVKLRPYVVQTILKAMSETIDSDDLMLEKAKFMADFEEQ